MTSSIACFRKKVTTLLDFNYFSDIMTVRAERVRKLSKIQLSACRARPKFSFLEENVTIRRASGPTTLVKVCQMGAPALARAGIHQTGPPDNSQMRALRPLKYAAKKINYYMYDRPREARPKIAKI